MNNSNYNYAKQRYAEIGIDTEEAIAKLQSTPISIHCWQGDDVRGFEGATSLDGGIQTTGNYPGVARNAEELMADIDKMLSLVPGKKRINLHANYAFFESGKKVDRDALTPDNFKKWVEFAKARDLGIDFNPTFFSHPMASSGLTLSNPNEEIRSFWIRHGIACLRIAEYFARELGTPCLLNFWIPDGYKEAPADRFGPRQRYADSMDQILATGYDKSLVYISLESKVFGIGVESYTVGSSEFCLNYAASRGIISLMDNGHYHPTEVVSDKIPSMLLFNQKIALHITRGVRWDSDHVVLFDDETREMAREIVRNNALDRVFIATDYFDASINRIAAWVIGARNVQKALLCALLAPDKKLKELQNCGSFTEMLMLNEELKFFPFAEVWCEFCRRNNIVPDESWFDSIKEYEKDVLSKRN